MAIRSPLVLLPHCTNELTGAQVKPFLQFHITSKGQNRNCNENSQYFKALCVVHFNFTLPGNEMMKQSSYKFSEYEKSQKLCSFVIKSMYYICVLGTTNILAQTFWSFIVFIATNLISLKFLVKLCKCFNISTFNLQKQHCISNALYSVRHRVIIQKIISHLS